MDRECVPLGTLTEGEFINSFDDDRLTEASKFKLPERKSRTSSSSASSADDIPLIKAVRRGCSSTTLFLKETKVPNVDLKETDRYQRNAFHYAITKLDMLKTLLEQFKTDPALKCVLLQEDKNGETPIHRAAGFGNVESLEILYEHDNALMKLRSKVNKRCVLHFAVLSSSTVTVQFVTSKAPEQMNMADYMARTPVHFAATVTQKDIIALLLCKGADPMKRDVNNQLPVHAAASKGLVNIVQLLIEDNPDCIDQFDFTNQTPLILAAKNGFENVVLYLLNEQADSTLKDTSGYSAFDWAVKNERPEVVEVFLYREDWKEIVMSSSFGAERCLKMLVEDMPDTSLILLDKCITFEGTVREPKTYQVKYDFFCFESKDEERPEFEALLSMVENKSEKCLTHPLCVKYVNLKWRKRAFKYNLAAILVAVVFHICLLVYTTQISGISPSTNVSCPCCETESYPACTCDERFQDRGGLSPNDVPIWVLRIIMLIIMFGMIVKELYQMARQGFKYFMQLKHYVQWTLFISVLMFLLPVNKKLTTTQRGSGSISVFFSWSILIQFLRIVPLVGVYILAVQKVFWTFMKVFIVVLIFLLSFATTFYILLGEHESYHDYPIAIVSTFVMMMSGPDYKSHFVPECKGIYPELYSLKLIVLVMFIIVMSIVVNNTLIGLAVGDTDEVMKSAILDKFLNKALFIIHLEKSVNRLRWFRNTPEKSLIEFPAVKKKRYEKFLDHVYFGGHIDTLAKIDGKKEVQRKVEEESATAQNDHLETLFATKIANTHSMLRLEFTEMFEKMEENHREDVATRKAIEEKMDKMFEKWS